MIDSGSLEIDTEKRDRDLGDSTLLIAPSGIRPVHRHQERGLGSTVERLTAGRRAEQGSAELSTFIELPAGREAAHRTPISEEARLAPYFWRTRESPKCNRISTRPKATFTRIGDSDASAETNA